jgi:hypothetical protein
MPENNQSQPNQALERVTTSNVSLSNIDNAPLDQQLMMFTEIAKDSNTGVNTPAMAMMLFHKAKELGIGWANAIPHMHLIKGKLGIDIHIIKAILSRPSAFITVEKIEDYKPLYKYIAKDFVTTYTSDTLPEMAVVVPAFDIVVPNNKFPVIVLPTMRQDDKGNKITSIEPYDNRTTYRFTRKKYGMGGEIITEVRTSSFSWQDAITAGLPLDRAGNFNTDSVWFKHRKLMVDHRAYTFGARDIASDLLLGAYEKTELFDMEHVAYDTTEVVDA